MNRKLIIYALFTLNLTLLNGCSSTPPDQDRKEAAATIEAMRSPMNLSLSKLNQDVYAQLSYDKESGIAIEQVSLVLPHKHTENLWFNLRTYQVAWETTSGTCYKGMDFELVESCEEVEARYYFIDKSLDKLEMGASIIAAAFTMGLSLADANFYYRFDYEAFTAVFNDYLDSNLTISPNEFASTINTGNSIHLETASTSKTFITRFARWGARFKSIDDIYTIKTTFANLTELFEYNKSLSDNQSDITAHFSAEEARLVEVRAKSIERDKIAKATLAQQRKDEYAKEVAAKKALRDNEENIPSEKNIGAQLCKNGTLSYQTKDDRGYIIRDRLVPTTHEGQIIANLEGYNQSKDRIKIRIQGYKIPDRARTQLSQPKMGSLTTEAGTVLWDNLTNWFVCG